MKNICYIGENVIDESQKKNIPRIKVAYTPWFHWCVFVDNTVYEVTGNWIQNVANYSSTEEEYLRSHKIIYMVELEGKAIITREMVILLINKWIRKYPVYSMFGANCQLFAKDFGNEFFGASMITQMDEYHTFGIYLYDLAVSWTIWTIFALFIALFLMFISKIVILYSKYIVRREHLA